MTHLERCAHPECNEVAEWVAYSGKPYDDVYACAEHLGALLGREPLYFVYPYPGDQERPVGLGLGYVYPVRETGG